jgi:hypothetical protein
MAKKTQSNPLSMSLTMVSMTSLIATGVATSFDSLHWLMAYLIWGWVASFGIFTVWTLFSINVGVTHGMETHGRLYKVYRSKKPRYFTVLSFFYLLLGCTGFVSILFILLSK